MDSTENTDHPGVIAFPPLIFAVCAAAGELLQFVYPLRVMNPHLAHRLGVLAALSAGSVALWAFGTMKAGGTNVNPSQPALIVVRGGPFRFTRNPMYLALCILQLALGLVFDSWYLIIFAIPLAFILHFGVILREERYLEAKFGEPYLALKREVRRWL